MDHNLDDIIHSALSLTDSEFEILKEAIITEIAQRAAHDARRRTEEAFRMAATSESTDDIPLTGNAASPPPVPSLEVHSPYGDGEDIVMETVKDCIMMIAKRCGIRAAIGWAKFQENVLPPLKVRSFTWTDDNDLAETLRPIIDTVADASFRHFKLLASSFTLTTAMNWIDHKMRQASRWIPSTDDYQGELLVAAAAAATPAAAAAPLPRPAISSFCCFATMPISELMGPANTSPEPAAPLPESAAASAEPAAAPAPAPKRPNYNHPLWPSPRPKNFVKALGFRPFSHEQSLKILAARAHMSVEQLLKWDSRDYANIHMKGYRAPLPASFY
jgi:hypothetical protein